MWLSFIGLTTLFAGFITIAGRMDSDCVQVSGNDFAAAGTPFSDAFALSWTVFTTVGYGTTNTALSHDNTNYMKCFWIDFVCSMEGLFGVIFSGFCGAILFGKILRIQSTAQVVFSDPLVIRYGAGVSGEYDVTSTAGDDGKSPCPVLEFRIVNKRYGDIGGEILDATLNVVAVAHKSYSKSFSPDSNHSMGTDKSDGVSKHKQNTTYDAPESQNTSQSNHQDNLLAEQEWREKIETNRIIKDDFIFSKMRVTPSDHPFFKRVWLVKHILDHESPLLKPSIRRQIRQNGGQWPQKLNHHELIRESLQFNQILVSLNGLSNVSAIDVYAQRIYDFVDVNIGYQLVNILYRAKNGEVGVDIDLLNDVREQVGSGGEPL